MEKRYITIKNAHENNLKNINLKIEKGSFTVVTGVSGSGKSSLVYNTIFKESERLYFSSFPSWSRKYLGVVSKPMADIITGLDAAIVVDQKNNITSARSTAGTFSGVYDMLRLLFSRFGTIPDNLKSKTEFFNQSGTLSRSLFSFNSETGACPACKGLGVEDMIDPELIIADKTKSIKERALKITAPNGYIIYSQVTLDVLDIICREHGFSIDTPLCELDQEQLNILFYGSKKILVPFGKHPLESRMKWTGITAKPREEGYYPGFITVMNEILKRDRNPNVLRFVRSLTCSNCGGSRLRHEALSVKFQDKSIYDIAQMSCFEIASFLREIKPQSDAEKILIDEIIKTLDSLCTSGLGHINLSRNSGSLSGGEIQRTKIAALTQNRLRGVLYIFDEPTVGLHRTEAKEIIKLLIALRDKGNTVLAVEHDTDTMLHADNIIETGPSGGTGGGYIIYSGSVEEFLKVGESLNSPTWQTLTAKRKLAQPRETTGELKITGASLNNLKNISVSFKKEAVNVITGVSGSGKRSLMLEASRQCEKEGLNFINIDRSPIGKTPRSNPATYTGIADKIRDLFAALEESKQLGLTKSHFSFNSEGGRCEACEGAGVIEIGMKFLGSVEVLCDKCHGRRFNDAVLNIRYKEKTISDIYSLSVSEALEFFSGILSVKKTLQIMENIGLGYLKLGQTTSSLSGGEAQRVRLAAFLSKTKDSSVLFFEEPTTGLHPLDIQRLTAELNRLVKLGNTVIAIEHDPDFISACDFVAELGPSSGKNGGNILYAGDIKGLVDNNDSPTALVMRNYLENTFIARSGGDNSLYRQSMQDKIKIEGITTHNLKNINFSLKPGEFTVITGVSGSGKTTLAFDTLFSESFRAFLEGSSPYIRSMLRGGRDCRVESSSGLMPPAAVSHKFTALNPRSTAGTVSGIYEIIRMLYSRAGLMPDGKPCAFTAGDFSFNAESGACSSCGGTGIKLAANMDFMISNPEKSFLNGAMEATKQGRFYGDINGQYIQTLMAVGNELGLDFSKPVKDISAHELDIALHGTGEKIYSIEWHYARGRVTGTHKFSGRWIGFENLITDEYHRSIGNKNEEELKKLMKEELCPACGGKRLKPELLNVTFAGRSIADLCEMESASLLEFISSPLELNFTQKTVFDALLPELNYLLGRMARIGLGHIALERAVSTMSLGERERLKLIKNSVNALENILYIIDEPSRGLHQSDCANIVSVIRDIIKNGNTVVAVEHEPSIILQADHIIEMGPGAGEKGGRIIFEGTVEELKNLKTPTSEAIVFSPVRQESRAESFIIFKSARARNLRDIDFKIPAGETTIITGVSGSGKTTLLKDVIAASISNKKAVNCREILNLPDNSKVFLHENKTAAPSSGKSVTATYTGVMELIKKRFAETDAAKAAGLKAANFSLSGDGVCPVCKGTGMVTIPMDFLADSSSACSECDGKGFRHEALEILLNGSNIADILAMSVEDARVFFKEDKKIEKILAGVMLCGLDYLTLGQQLSTYSTGEIQRIDLAMTLYDFSLKKDASPLFFIFDEPSTGLHHADIKKLLSLFDSLNRAGHTVIIADHRQQIITHAHHIIVLGPGCGNIGGRVIFEGSPFIYIDLPNHDFCDTTC